MTTIPRHVLRQPLDPTVLRPPDTRRDEDDGTPAGRVRCPQCLWVPDEGSRWVCSPAGPPVYFDGGCGMVWHTFTTGGCCPGCGHVWQWTSCLRCLEWSPHADWYVDAADDA